VVEEGFSDCLQQRKIFFLRRLGWFSCQQTYHGQWQEWIEVSHPWCQNGSREPVVGLVGPPIMCNLLQFTKMKVVYHSLHGNGHNQMVCLQDLAM